MNENSGKNSGLVHTLVAKLEDVASSPISSNIFSVFSFISFENCKENYNQCELRHQMIYVTKKLMLYVTYVKEPFQVCHFLCKARTFVY